MSNESKTKVFGVGLHRTGTTSLRAAMPRLGYKTVPPWQWQGRYAGTLDPQDVLTDAFNLAASHDACIYMPFITFYEELHAQYPDAKFILTERNEDKWVKSMHAYFGGMDWPEVRFVFGVDADKKNAQTLRRVFREHNRAVKEFFADKPGKLLVMNISNGDGWKELCAFLGQEMPAGEKTFPRENARHSAYATFVKNAIPTVASIRRFILGR